jgi:alpha-tubulin suppressor-like RCC1 family protein
MLVMLGVAGVGGCGTDDGSLGPRDEGPTVAPLVVPQARVFTQVGVGFGFACALRDDGIVECTGISNDDGQAPPIRVSLNGSPYRQVSANQDFACAVRADGVVECWGNNDDLNAPPTVAASTGRFTQVMTGSNHACGLRDDGVAECWGRNLSGQAPAQRAASSGAFTQLAGGALHTCGLRTDGLVECWGNDAEGGAPPLRAPLTAGTYVDLAVSSFTTCAVRSDGVVECWGRNSFEQALPERAPAAGRFVRVATADRTCAVRDDGAVECWGQGGLLQREPPASGVFTRVASDESSNCAVRSDGVVICWGFLLNREFSASPSTTRVNPTATFVAPASAVVGVPFQLALGGAAVPGYPLATSFTYAFDCGAGTGYGAPSGANTASCPTSATGTRTVRGRVIDQDGDLAEYTAQVAIVTVSQATSDLLTGVSTASLSPDLRKALTTKLRSALDAIAKGRTNAACAALQDFINQVNAQRGKAIPTATADAWIAQATQLRTALGC